MIKKYYLVRADARAIVDVREYKDVIILAYKKVNPQLVVCVSHNHYTVKGNLTRSQAVLAGRIIAKSSLGRYAVSYPKYGKKTTTQLFRGKVIERRK